MKARPSLFQTARSLTGNQRAIVMVEPLWSLPYNLFLPFASVYMAALGLTDAQIGTVASAGLVTQFFWTIFSGAIIDKFGRRPIMLLFDILSWAIPCVLWAVAQNYWYFFLAALFNGMWRVSGNCYGCIALEDGDPDKLVGVYAILYIFGTASGFLAPLAGLFFERFTLAPTMRAIYAAAVFLLSAKFVLQYRLTTDSRMSLRRMEECRGQSLLSLTFGGYGAFAAAIKQPKLYLLLALIALNTCFNTVQTTFWPLFVTGEYGVSDSTFTLLPLVKAATALVVYLFVTARISLRAVRRPLLVGFVAQALGLAFLLSFLPLGHSALFAVFISAMCDAVALAILSPIFESLIGVTLPPAERARVYSMMIALLLIVSAPIGWIAGQLSQMHRALPFVLNLVLLAAEIFVAVKVAGMAGEGEKK